MPIFTPNSALLLVDFQTRYRAIVPASVCAEVARLLELARSQGVPVVHVRELKYPTKSARFYNALTRRRGERVRRHRRAAPPEKALPFATEAPSEQVIVKDGYDSFYGTRLHAELQRRGVTDLYVCGVLSGVCVLNTVFSAFNRGYFVHLVEAACADRTAKRHRSVLDNYRNYLYLPA